MRRWHCIAAVLLQAGCGATLATDVTVVGLFPGKAVVQIDGGAIQTLSAGQKTPEGVTLIAVGRGTATLEIDGRRRTLTLGQHHAGPPRSSAASVTIPADARGHFVVDGQVNGLPVRFMVDTGATVVSLSAAEARRLGIDYARAPRAFLNTANGRALAWRVTLDTVRVGDISLDRVSAVVVDTPGMPALLGMSFLDRMDMRREGRTLTLTRRY